MVEQVNAYHLEKIMHPPVAMKPLEVDTVPLQEAIVHHQAVAVLRPVGMEHLQMSIAHLPVGMGHLLPVIDLQPVGMVLLPVGMGHLQVNMVHHQVVIVSHLQVGIQPQLLGTEPQRKATMPPVLGMDHTRATQVTTRLRRNTSMSPQMLLLCQIGYCP